MKSNNLHKMRTPESEKRDTAQKCYSCEYKYLDKDGNPTCKNKLRPVIGFGSTDEKSIKIREYKLPALMQLLYSNGRKPVKCRAEKTKYRRKSYMAMIKSKRLTSKRGITLPKDLCEYVGMQPGEAVDLIVDNQTGEIHIRKHVPVCRFCGNRTETVNYNGIDICPECADVMSKAVIK